MTWFVLRCGNWHMAIACQIGRPDMYKLPGFETWTIAGNVPEIVYGPCTEQEARDYLEDVVT